EPSREWRDARAPADGRKRGGDPRKPSTPPSGPAAAATDVRRATAAIAIAAQTGWLPVANATTVRTSARPAEMTATRREIPEGPPEPDAATTAPVSAARRLPLNSGKAAPSAPPTTRPQNR